MNTDASVYGGGNRGNLGAGRDRAEGLAQSRAIRSGGLAAAFGGDLPPGISHGGEWEEE